MCSKLNKGDETDGADEVNKFPVGIVIWNADAE